MFINLSGGIEQTIWSARCRYLRNMLLVYGLIVEFNGKMHDVVYVRNSNLTQVHEAGKQFSSILFSNLFRAQTTEHMNGKRSVTPLVQKLRVLTRSGVLDVTRQVTAIRSTVITEDDGLLGCCRARLIIVLMTEEASTSETLVNYTRLPAVRTSNLTLS